MEVRIRALTEEDAYASVAWRNKPEIWEQTEFKATREITLEDELTWIRKVTVDPTSRRFAILADERYVGNIYITDIRDGVGEYQIFIGEERYWGKGVARTASQQIIEFGKTSLGLLSIKLRVRETNHRALSLYQSLGFEATGEEGDFTTMILDLARNSET